MRKLEQKGSFMDWMSIPSKIHTLKSNPHCDGIWKWYFYKVKGHKDEVFMSGISTFMKTLA